MSDQQTTLKPGQVWSPHPGRRTKPRIILNGTHGRTVWSAALKADGKQGSTQCWDLRRWLMWVSDNAAEKVA